MTRGQKILSPPTPSSPALGGARPARFRRWQPWLAVFAVSLGIAFSIRADFARRSNVAALSKQGSPPPPVDAKSPTGYAGGQRYFVGAEERGETFRWIAAAQAMIASGSRPPATYTKDNTPDGRASLDVQLYTAWLAGLAWVSHLFTGRPIGLAIEEIALWEPILAHFIALASAVVFLSRRFGLLSGAIGGIFVSFFPAISSQFLPGVLSPRPWAMLLAAYALGVTLDWAGSRSLDESRKKRASLTAGLAAGVAIWLDPAIGFPVVLVTGIAGTAVAAFRPITTPWLRWSIAGATTVMIGWLIDRVPLALNTGELRTVHPFYAIVWLGVGIFLHGLQARQTAPARKRKEILLFICGALIIAGSAAVQIKTGFSGWIYPSLTLQHLSSLDEARPPCETILVWIRNSPGLLPFFTLMPAFAALLLTGRATWSAHGTQRGIHSLFALTLLLGLLVLAYFRVRWWPVLSVLPLPIIASLLPGLRTGFHRAVAISIGCYLVALVTWSALTPPSRDADNTGAADVEALVFRHFTQWLVSHNPPGSVSAFATPVLSDAMVYHGGCQVLMSTAWESYPGHVAASRVLSAPDWNEAEGILRNRNITHVVVNSWDRILPQFVRAPEAHRNETFHARLQRWVFPRFLRPIPYQIPAHSGFDGQTIVVLRMTETQDEALALGRLAEYFAEMNRDYLATAAARILGQSHAEEPNAMIACAIVFDHVHDRAGFEIELDRLARRLAKEAAPPDWDRRVQRAIVFALGGRHDLARPEISACVADLSPEHVYDLTPLQAYRFLTLTNHYEISFPRAELRRLVESLCTEYSKRPPSADPR
jgi:hypothetical protein